MVRVLLKIIIADMTMMRAGGEPTLQGSYVCSWLCIVVMIKIELVVRYEVH